MDFDHCPICNAEIPHGTVLNRLLDDYWTENAPPDFAGLAQMLQTEYELHIDETTIHNHLENHVNLTPGGGR